MEDTDTPMAWDEDITEEKGIICIDWRIVTGLLDNIDAGTEINTLFFGASIEIL